MIRCGSLPVPVERAVAGDCGCEEGDDVVVVQTEIWRMGAGQLAEAIRARQISSREVVEAHLERIAAVNPAVNAVTLVLAEEARAAADAADAAVRAGASLGPLHGVPVTVKENIDLAGSATTQGLPAFSDAIPPEGAPICRISASAGTPTTRCAARRAIPGTPAARPAVQAAARRRRWRRG
jgi:hypothetical protein